MEAVQPVRVKYIKFTSAMDVALLELIQVHNPIAAKHGTRLAMWERVARDFGAQIFDNRTACKWQICRDRGNLLMRWFDEERFDKLFKDESEARNRRKEALLQSLRHASTLKLGTTSSPSPTKSSPTISLHGEHPPREPPLSLMPTRPQTPFPTESSPPSSSSAQRHAMFSPSPVLYRPPMEASTGVPSPPIHLPSLKVQVAPAENVLRASSPCVANPSPSITAERTKSLQEHPPDAPFKVERAAPLHPVGGGSRLHPPPRHTPSPPHLPSLVHPNQALLRHHPLHHLTSAAAATRKRKVYDMSFDSTAAQLVRIVEQKLQLDMDMRRRDQHLRAQELHMQHQLVDYLHSSRQSRRRLDHGKTMAADSTVNDRDEEEEEEQDGGAAARLLELLQHKMQFDMAHHAAEMDLRADEVELQRRVLAYLARC
ncbi:hypothetical protein B5M09_006038 [Aphanomyces astaci]|nr:hypothetical protein B5M09_006038 [Aphanomyces astaci]